MAEPRGHALARCHEGGPWHVCRTSSSPRLWDDDGPAEARLPGPEEPEDGLLPPAEPG